MKNTKPELTEIEGILDDENTKNWGYAIARLAVDGKDWGPDYSEQLSQEFAMCYPEKMRIALLGKTIHRLATAAIRYKISLNNLQLSSLGDIPRVGDFINDLLNSTSDEFSEFWHYRNQHCKGCQEHRPGQPIEKL